LFRQKASLFGRFFEKKQPNGHHDLSPEKKDKNFLCEERQVVLPLRPDFEKSLG
jgi:hypothetical protein